MIERIRLGHKDGEHGLWVAPPNVDIATTDRYLMSSAQDMLKVHFQGEHTSVSTYDDSLFWLHDFEIPYPDLGYIPLALIGTKTPGGTVAFPADLGGFSQVQWTGTVNAMVMGVVGFKSDRLVVSGFHASKTIIFYYTVFRYKLLDGV